MNYFYRVLGPVQVLRPDGASAPVGGARLRALLTALAAAGGRPVQARELVGRVWDGDDAPPADEAAALQALVGRLRRALGKEAVLSAPGGYRLAAGPDDVDLFRFERLAAQGTKALEDGEADRAVALLDEALALWRGPALADLPGRDGDPSAVRADRGRTRARRTRAAAEVAAGRAEGALEDLAALAAEQPLDEPVQALWIRALRAAGRRAEALTAYEEVRTLLAERLGTDPGAELRSVHAELLAVDRRPAPGNLRARLTSFVGRESELAALSEELRVRRLVTLLGPGGVGKTRLALEAAAAAAQMWPDGVWVTELASVRDGAAVADSVLTALGAREPAAVRGPASPAPLDPTARLVEHCGARRTLLVLDNCEQVAQSVAELTQTVLTRCPGVSVLTTSREPLGAPGEWVRTVEPLPPEVALRLLAERGAAARPGFRTADDPAACAEICRRLDGLPLAVELAAARLRALAPHQIADRLDDRFRLLGDLPSGGSRTALPRQQTLRAVVDWSWELLNARERAALRRLAVFSGGCELAEAEAVCGSISETARASVSEDDTPGPPEAPGPADTLGLLASLVDKSLVVAAPAGPRGMRYRLLETVAEYAGERLDEAGERAAVEARHLAAYRELVRTGAPRLHGPAQAEWLERFETEHDNIRAALRTAVDRGAEQDALCMALSMSWFWQLSGRQADALTWSAAAAGLGPDPFDAPVRTAPELREACTDRPPPWSDEQLWEARRGAHLLVLASSGGDGASWMEKPETQDRLRAIVAAYPPGLPQTCRQPGTMWFFARLTTGGFAGFDETMEALVQGCREHGFDWNLGFALLMRAKLLSGHDGDADEALTLFERAGDLWGVAESLSARGEAYDRSGRYAEAAADFERAMESSARIGAHTQVPLFKARLASVRLETAVDAAAAASAEALLVEAVDEARTYAGEAALIARTMLAQHLGRTSRTGLAREQLRALETEFTVATPALFTGMVAGVHGWLDCVDGAYEQALRQIRVAARDLESLVFLVAPHLIVSQFPSAAWAMACLGMAEDAARLLGAYDHHTSRPECFGFHQYRPEAEAEIRRRAGDEVRARLDGPSRERAYARGRELSLQDAAALI
ncbi:MAG TPA: BTAD domain-containing putative transcriptional regulator [Streptomyces sp.]|nr:BTAD domain-containing putative transcriptional regulator [Streptomyces sp.]